MSQKKNNEVLEFGSIELESLEPENCARFIGEKCNLNIKKYPQARECTGYIEDCAKYKRTITPSPDPTFLFKGFEEAAEAIAYCLKEDVNAYIVGPAGCGKSSLCKQILSLANMGMVRYSCSAESRWSHIFGQFILTDGNMYWQDGYILNAYRNGYVLMEEESDFMLPELRGSVHTIMEQKSSVHIDAKHAGKLYKENVLRHKHFRWISLANTKGYIENFDYAGTQLQNVAARDRYGMLIELNYPHSEAEFKIVKQHLKVKKLNGIKDKDIEKIVEVANKCRQAKKEATFEGTFTLRRSIAWAIAANYFDIEKASKLSVTNFLLANDQLVFTNLVNTYWEINIPKMTDPNS